MTTTKKVGSVRSSKRTLVTKKTGGISRAKKTKLKSAKSNVQVSSKSKKVSARKKKNNSATISINSKKSAKPSNKKNRKSTHVSKHKHQVKILPAIGKAPLAIALFSAMKLPINLDTFAVQTARIGGLIVLVAGAAFTLLYSQYIWNTPASSFSLNQAQMTASVIKFCDVTMGATEFEQCVKHNQILNNETQSQSSASSHSSTKSTSVSQQNNLVVSDSFVKEPPVTFNVDVVDQPSGLVTILISVDNALDVEVLVFKNSYQEPVHLGNATLINGSIWEYVWDTTKFSDASYKVAADISNVYTFDKPYRDSDIKYLDISNTIIDTSSTATSSQESSNTDVFLSDAAEARVPVNLELTSRNPIEGIANFKIMVADAIKVSVIAKHKKSGSINRLGDATFVSGTIWSYKWDTTKYINGEYIITTKIKTIDTAYEDGKEFVAVNNIELSESKIDEENDVQDTNGTTTNTVDIDESESEILTEIPKVTLSIDNSETISGKIDIDIAIQQTRFVELWVTPKGSNIDKIIGLAKRNSPTSDEWTYLWKSNSTPNGDYELYARVKNEFGLYKSNVENISVYNKPFTPKLSEEQKEESNDIEKAKEIEKNILKEIKESKESEKDKLSAQESSKKERQENEISTATETELASPVTLELAPIKKLKKKSESSTDTEKIIDSFNKDINDELMRLTTAYRSNDPDRIERAEERMSELKDEILSTVATDKRTDVLMKNLDTGLEKIVAEHKILANKVETLIKERVGDDVFKDSDSDGISNYDERTLYNTDPYSADTDGDGFNDGSEIAEGYDPLDIKREVAVAYESPIDKGVVREDILAVESILAIQPDDPSDDTDGVSAQAIISGRALPNSFVTLYVFSVPTVVTVKTEADGTWQYRFDKELEDGEHNIYVGVTDNAGRIVAKSAAFTFVKEAQAFTPADAIAGVDVTENSGDSLLSIYMIYLILSVSVVSIGLVLILLGLHLETRQRRFKEVIKTEDES